MINVVYALVPIPDVIGLVVALLVALACGWLGNHLYLAKARRVVADAREQGLEGQALLAAVAQRGGTSVAAAAVTALLYTVTYGVIVLCVLIASYEEDHGYKEQWPFEEARIQAFVKALDRSIREKEELLARERPDLEKLERALDDEKTAVERQQQRVEALSDKLRNDPKAEGAADELQREFDLLRSMRLKLESKERVLEARKARFASIREQVDDWRNQISDLKPSGTPPSVTPEEMERMQSLLSEIDRDIRKQDDAEVDPLMRAKKPIEAFGHLPKGRKAANVDLSGPGRRP